MMANLWRLRSPRRAAWLMALVLLPGLFLLGKPGPALAHAVLLRSDPAQNARLNPAPSKIDLFFSEPVNHNFSSIQVQNSSGTRVDRKALHFSNDPTEIALDLPALDPGFYTVVWTTLSAADGHKL